MRLALGRLVLNAIIGNKETRKKTREKDPVFHVLVLCTCFITLLVQHHILVQYAHLVLVLVAEVSPPQPFFSFLVYTPVVVAITIVKKKNTKRTKEKR